jgi:tRNA G18 (ribose-2'-O)-methylase SpoU
MDELKRKSISEFRQSDKIPVVVILENIRSMHNVGSVFRTADAFLIESLYLCGYTPQPPHRNIHKTALGSTETVKWFYFGSAVEAIDQLKLEGYSIWGIEQVERSVKLNNTVINKTEKIAIVFGNEVEGISNEVLKLCDGCIEIPQLGMKHSLNVSVAAGIVLWELVRSRLF